MAKMAIVVLSGSENPTRARAGLHVAKRIHDARPGNGVDVVEVFLFTDGLRLLSERGTELSGLIEELLAAGIPVGGCRNQLNDWGLAETAADVGVASEYARDAFARYAREGYTVLTF